MKLYTHPFIHSRYFYSDSSSPLLFRGAPDASMTLCWSLHVEALQATVSEGLAQGPYVVARAGFEPATLRMQGTELTTEPKHRGFPSSLSARLTLEFSGTQSGIPLTLQTLSD